MDDVRRLRVCSERRRDDRLPPRRKLHQPGIPAPYLVEAVDRIARGLGVVEPCTDREVGDGELLAAQMGASREHPVEDGPELPHIRLTLLDMCRRRIALAKDLLEHPLEDEGRARGIPVAALPELPARD